MKKIPLFILFIITSQALMAGGPWPQKKGKGYFKLSEWWTVFNQHFTDEGLIDPNVTTGVYNTSLYAEYGISDKFTILVNAPLFSRNVMNNSRSMTTNEIIKEGGAINSMGDIDLGVKYGLTALGSKIPVAISLTLGLPTGKTEGGIEKNLQTGDGEFNQLFQIDAGKGFNIGSTPVYFSTYVGVNNRTNSFSEELRFGAELGASFFNSKLWITSRLNAIESFKNGATAEDITSTSIFANNTEYISIGLEFNYYITSKIGVSIGAASALRGEIIAARPSYQFGVFYDMK